MIRNPSDNETLASQMVYGYIPALFLNAEAAVNWKSAHAPNGEVVAVKIDIKGV